MILSEKKAWMVILPLLVFISTSLWASFINPDWAFMFLLDIKKIGGEYILPFLAPFYILIFILGYTLGKKLDRPRRMIVLLLCGLALAIAFALTYERVFLDVRYENFILLPKDKKIHLEDILNFFKTYLGKNLIVGGTMFLATTSFCIMYKETKRDK